MKKLIIAQLGLMAGLALTALSCGATADSVGDSVVVTEQRL